MMSRTTIKIDKVENLEVSYPYSLREKILEELLRGLGVRFPGALPELPTLDQDGIASPWIVRFEMIAKVASIVSAVAAVVFVAFLWSGRLSVANIAVKNALTVVSFTLVGGLVSIGGVKLVSINASLRRAIAAVSGCPFVPLFQRGLDTDHLRRPGNPNVCMKCPLGVDINSNVRGGLMHNCRVYEKHHAEWLKLPGAQSMLHR